MASIRCQWGHVHATVAEVRVCDADHRAEAGGADGLFAPDLPSGAELEGRWNAEPLAAAGPEELLATDPVAWAGPDWLGRDAIMAPDQAVPGPWAGAPVVALADLRLGGAAALEPLWARRHARQRTVFVVDGDLPARPSPAARPGPTPPTCSSSTTSSPTW